MSAAGLVFAPHDRSVVFRSVFCTLLLLLQGCAYIQNRLSDSMDVFILNGEIDYSLAPSAALTVGPWRGIGFQSRPTESGTGPFEYNAWGLMGGTVGTNAFHAISAALWLNKERFVTTGRRNKSYSLESHPLIPWIYYDDRMLADYREHFGVSAVAPKWLRWGDVNVYAGWGVGIRVGINLCEIIDLAAGVVGLDPGQDDT